MDSVIAPTRPRGEPAETPTALAPPFDRLLRVSRLFYTAHISISHTHVQRASLEPTCDDTPSARAEREKHRGYQTSESVADRQRKRERAIIHIVNIQPLPDLPLPLPAFDRRPACCHAAWRSHDLPARGRMLFFYCSFISFSFSRSLAAYSDEQ